MSMMSLKELNPLDGALKTHHLGCVNITWMLTLAHMHELSFCDEMNTFSRYGITLKSYSRNNLCF